VKVLILGCDGQLGRELSQLCTQRKLTAAFYRRSDCDIAEKAQVVAAFAATMPNAVINAAAYTNVDQAEAEPGLAFRANREGPANLASAAAAHGIPLIHVSTDFVFDGSKARPYVETDAVAPLNVYGLSKEAGEREVRRLQERHVIVRTSWLYGRYGRNFLKTMLGLASTRENWGVVNDQIGTPTASQDLALAVLAAAEQAAAGVAKWGTYHFAGAGEATWFDFAGEILEVQRRFCDRRPSIAALSTEEYPTLARRPRNSRLNSDRFASTFGVRAAPWRDRVFETVRMLARS
jgi:dTDP-4-dehydrorhamnose reductase